MRRRIRNTAHSYRRPLTSDWELCATAPGAVVDPSGLNAAAHEWLPATAPSTVASVLRTHRRWSLDHAPRRFDSEDWWYRTRFDPAPGSTSATLGFDGLATIAEVWLNGVQVLTSTNMFLAHEIPIASLLPQANELVLCFRSLDTALTARRPRPRWRSPMIENQQLRWYRTTVLGRTPGWSPPAQAVGPWRPVWVATAPALDLLDANLQVGVTGNDGWVSADCEVIGLPSTARCVLLVSRGEQTTRIELPRTDARRFTGRGRVRDPALWWPHTHGVPALYTARLQAMDVGGATLVDFDLGSIAFRTITLNTENAGFEICVNGTPVFCRGACWTPPDPVSLNADTISIDETLERVRAAGMNMLRVGGTMVYESEHFYDVCDALGILVWQDLMFANMDYPVDDAGFVDSVNREISQTLARLGAHPCLALLCGNSEVEQQAAMWGASRDLWSPPLFHEVIAKHASTLCPDVPYWPSSAHGGAFPHLNDVGSTSYYGVGAYLRALDDARRSQVKFASECLAFANVPELSTLAAMPGGVSVKVHHPGWKSRSPRDLGAGWDFDDVRDHYLADLFKVDPLKLRYADHERYLAMSRVATAEVMAASFSEWRRHGSVCGGALIWFLRDLWPGAGWGIIGADSAPKAPYYYLRRALQSVSVWMSDEGNNGVSVHVANDLADGFDAQVELTLYRNGETVIARQGRTLRVDPRQSHCLPAADWFDGFRDLSNAYRFGPASHDLIVATLRTDRLGEPLQSVYFPLGPPGLTSNLGLTATAHSQGEGLYQLTLTSRAFAYAVAVEADGFLADDQYFHVAPGEQRQISLRSIPGTKTRPLRGQVSALNAQSAATIQLSA